MLQPWTPCLPIRGGKLKTSKYFSSSNPQLPFVCSSSSFVSSCNNHSNNNRTNLSSSLNSSYIWREATPNSFNMYSASVSSLNTAHRYSLGTNTGSPEWRPMSEEKMANRKMFLSQLKQKANFSSYENPAFSPLLATRKNKQAQALMKSSANNDGSPRKNSIGNLYNLKLNRSFEAPSSYDVKTGPLRRSTPHLAADIDNKRDNSSNRHSATWCCGQFVLKQWRKIHNYE